MPKLTATDELRAMLDERGVEWWPMHDVENGYHQDRDTEFVIDGKKYTAHEWGGTLNVYGLTPEQAIEATLGRGTCHLISAPQYGEGCQECSSCGEVLDGYLFDGVRCPNCGAKVVKE